ncbi:MAG: serine/threonine-protein phosphatase [Oscillospiraceae bacterium]|jgi:Serine/threonine protein phosphatase|nr:serine/threonine-protein phosphatase [Oscillospiraceae bacterium]MBQ4241022.1 serine/threonine-protein phosphatase [Oscillospiraceae bacterium]MBQ5412556.1 serine/threonine-protein phosphatase [Oscillospiraceae bacterium]
MNVTGFTDIGLKYEVNQDCYLAGRINDSLYWMILCDGMGGLAFGERASRIVSETVCEILRDNLSGINSTSEISDLITYTLKKANARLLEESRALQGDIMMGTTAVLAVVRNREAVIGHCGDSRAYHYQKNSLTQLTKDHSVVQGLLDSGKITLEQAMNHPNKNIITNALGVERGLRIDIDTARLKKGDMIMLCSDGLSNILTSDEMCRILSDTDFYESAERLVRRALEEGAYDNTTAVVLKV